MPKRFYKHKLLLDSELTALLTKQGSSYFMGRVRPLGVNEEATAA